MSTPWTTAWTQATTDIALTGLMVADQTIRLRVTAAVGGDHLRVRLSNRFGHVPLTIAHAAVRVRDTAADLTFSAMPGVEVSTGGEVVSDPAALAVADGDVVELDVHLPGRQALSTGNIASAQWFLSAPGDHVGSADFPTGGTPTTPHPDGGEIPQPAPILRAVEVSRAAGAPVVVCLGDSITAAGWPERAAMRLGGRGIAVVNRGIGGNRLRFDGAGPLGAFFGRAGVDRFDDDVVGTCGRTHLVLALGTNDLGHPGGSAPIEELPTADELIRALDDTVGRAHDAGLSVFLATITPFLPAAGYDARREETRRAVNAWIGAQEPRVRVLDFAAAVASAVDPARLDEAYDSGDHLHPNDAGQERLAEAAAEVIGAAV